jgi:hypothetical protein
MSDPLRCWDPAHRSYSADKAWDGCQYLAQAEIDGLVERSFPAKVARGSAVDDAVMAMIDGREPIDLEGTYRRYCREYNVQYPDEDKEIASATAQIDLFEREVLSTLDEVYATQMEVHWTLDDVEYHAHLDIVYADGSIDDLKAPDQRLGVRRADEDPQLTTYAASLYGAFGNLPPRVGLIGLVNGKMPEDVSTVLGIRDKDRPKPWVDRQTSRRTLAQLAAWEDEARRREASRRWARSTGIYQTQGRTQLYSCNGCAAKALCPAWSGFDLGTEANSTSEAAA